MIDVLIIGAGPAGISAGIYAKRSNLNVTIIYYGESNLEKAPKIDNYYGFEDGISGVDLYKNGIEQAKKIGIDVLNEEVLHIELNDNCFEITTNISSYKSKSVIIASGNKKLKPDIDGIKDFEGKGISYCAICDGFFYKNKNIAIIGDGRFAINEADYLKNIVNSITILSNGKTINSDCNYNVNNKKIKKVTGENTVNKVVFDDDTFLSIDGIFIALGEAGGVDFAKSLGVITNNDNIIVNDKMETNIKGLYSCGNTTGGLLQICKAVYEGAVAGISAANFVKKNNS